jgi:hypothetical protein
MRKWLTYLLPVLAIGLTAYFLISGKGIDLSRKSSSKSKVSAPKGPVNYVCRMDPSIPDLDQDEKDYFISVARDAISDFFAGKKPKGNWPRKYENIDNKVYVVLRKEGRRMGSWYTKERNLAHTVYMATLKNLRDNEIAEASKDSLDIHVFVMGNYERLDTTYGHGIHGIRFAKGKKGANYYSAYGIETNYKIDKLEEKLLAKSGIKNTSLRDTSLHKYQYNSLHFGTTPYSDTVTTFFRGNTPSFVPQFSLGKMRSSLALAKGWLVSNVRDDGEFNYLYHPSSRQYPESNNMIRQLMGSRLLAELSWEDESLLKTHRKNLNHVMLEWYKEKGNIGYILYDGKSKLGANAMALRTLVYSPYFEQNQVQAERLARGILSLQNPDGSLEPWLIEPDYAYDKAYLLTFYSGEAILSLVEYFLRTGNREYLDAALLSQEYYIHEYVSHLVDNYYPAYVPWHTQSLNKLYKITGDTLYAEAAMVMNDILIQIQNQDGVPFPDLRGRFYDPQFPQYGTPHSSSDAVYTEGLAYAYELAVLTGDQEHMDRFRDAILLGVHNLMNLQYNGANMYFVRDPEKVLGAIRYRAEDNRVRVDTTQHMMDAFIKVLDVFGGPGAKTAFNRIKKLLAG